MMERKLTHGRMLPWGCFAFGIGLDMKPGLLPIHNFPSANPHKWFIDGNILFTEGKVGLVGEKCEIGSKKTFPVG